MSKYSSKHYILNRSNKVVFVSTMPPPVAGRAKVKARRDDELSRGSSRSNPMKHPPRNVVVEPSRPPKQSKKSTLSRASAQDPQSYIEASKSNQTPNPGSGSGSPVDGDHGRSNLDQALKFMEEKLGIEEQPSKTLVIVWFLMMTGLVFDFVTTIISFVAFANGSDCCGTEIQTGGSPFAITVPFFILILMETFMLFRIISLTLWPSILAPIKDDQDEENQSTRSRCVRQLTCIFRRGKSALLYSLSISVIFNPYFGCIIAWLLMYTSDKTESFVVLGLEGASIVLHFVRVWLEGSCKSRKMLFVHSLQLIPFLVSITLILLYLRQGGICYLVNEEEFRFTGCELCPDGMPPVDGVCTMEDGTNITITKQRIWKVRGDFSDFKEALLDRSVLQDNYCGADNPDGPDVDFCFFPY